MLPCDRLRRTPLHSGSAHATNKREAKAGAWLALLDALLGGGQVRHRLFLFRIKGIGTPERARA
jgi:hypothetical protein